MKGKVKFFNETKKFGFIAGDDGKEYFVHQTELEEGVTLHENDAVTFDVEEGDKGPKAVKVKKEEGDKDSKAVKVKKEEGDEGPKAVNEKE